MSFTLGVQSMSLNLHVIDLHFTISCSCCVTNLTDWFFLADWWVLTLTAPTGLMSSEADGESPLLTPSMEFYQFDPVLPEAMVPPGEDIDLQSFPNLLCDDDLQDYLGCNGCTADIFSLSCWCAVETRHNFPFRVLSCLYIKLMKVWLDSLFFQQLFLVWAVLKCLLIRIHFKCTDWKKYWKKAGVYRKSYFNKANHYSKFDRFI